MHTETLTNVTFEDLSLDPAADPRRPESGLDASRGILLACCLGSIVWSVIGYLLIS